MSTPTRSFWLGSSQGSGNVNDPGFFISPGRRSSIAQRHGTAATTSHDAQGFLHPRSADGRPSIDQQQQHHQRAGSHSGYDTFFRKQNIISEDVEPGSAGTSSGESYRPSKKSALTELLRQSPPDEQRPFPSATIRPTEPSRDDSRHKRRTSIPDEYTGLLSRSSSVFSDDDDLDEDLEGQIEIRSGGISSTLDHAREKVGHAITVVTTPKLWDGHAVFQATVVEPAKALPAVFVGSLLNILDALSYGMILFPLGVPMFSGLGPDGVTIFYVSTIVSQLVYSFGASAFRGAIGSEMIEVVPFFHKMALAILAQVGEDNPKSVLATTMVTYCLSALVTGLVFFFLGACGVGRFMRYAPGHLLQGCIGGVGWFLIATAIQVSANLGGGLEYNLHTLKQLIEPHTLMLWTVPLGIAVVLKLVESRVRWNYFVPCYFVAVFVIFYIVVLAVPELSLEQLRVAGWVFELPQANLPWWHAYTLFSLQDTNWKAVISTIPSMFAVTFFGILHVPINIPAMANSCGMKNVNFDRELIAHGISNTLSGLCGSIQNYLVYSNSVLFMRSGGSSRLAGAMLAVATVGLLMAGPVVIGFIPTLMVGALIFVLGAELLREALIDTFREYSWYEYITIVVTTVTMGVYDFVVGILIGILLYCIELLVRRLIENRKSTITS